VFVSGEAGTELAELQQQPIRLITRWHSNEGLGQTLALMLLEQAEELARWQARPERLLMLHGGPFDNLGDGLVFEAGLGDSWQKLSDLRFARLVLRKNVVAQYEAAREGWHVHAFYPVAQLPLEWTGDRSFRYLARHLAGYFVSGIESEWDGSQAAAADLELVASSGPAHMSYWREMLEPLVRQVWPVEIAATFWQEQLNRPLRQEDDAPALLAEWARQFEQAKVLLN